MQSASSQRKDNFHNHDSHLTASLLRKIDIRGPYGICGASPTSDGISKQPMKRTLETEWTGSRLHTENQAEPHGAQMEKELEVIANN
jgi:hypothetical protein